MKRYRIDDVAVEQIEDIYIHSFEAWGEAQAEAYIDGLYAMLDEVAENRVAWRVIPATFPVEGYLRRYRSHIVYWRVMEDGGIGVVAVLHQRMHQSDRLRKIFYDEP